MQLQYDLFSFRDFMNYTSPMSLSAFCKSCGIEEISKSIFPYELYDDVQQLRDATEFPDYKYFLSSLGKKFNADYILELKEIAKTKFESGQWSLIR